VLDSIKKICSEKKFYSGLFEYYSYAIRFQSSVAGNYDKAWVLHDSMRNLLASNNLKQFNFLTSFCKGYIYLSQGNNDSAVVYYLQAANDSRPDSSYLNSLNQNLAILFYYQGNYKQAVEYQVKALDLDRQNSDTVSMIGAYGNLYGFTMAAKDTVAAGKNILTALSYVNEAKPLNVYASIYLNTGEYYMAVNKPDSAIKYLGFFLNFVKNRFPESATAQAKVILGKAYILNHDFNKGGALLSAAASLGPMDSLPVLMRKNYYEADYLLQKHNNNIPAALKTFEKLTALKDELNAREKNKQLLEYDRKEKDLGFEKQILQTKLLVQQKNNSLQLISLVGGTVVLVLLAGVLYWRKQKKNESDKVVLLLKEKQLEKKNALLLGQLEERSRISQELHDELGATVTSIVLATELMKQRTDQANLNELEIVSRSSKEMTDKLNEIVWSLNTNNDTTQSLVAYIRKFSSGFLQEAGIALEFEEQTDFPGRVVNGMFRRSIYHTAKEAVHNIVKHAGATRAVIHIQSNPTGLTILIKDNGKGLNNLHMKDWNNGLGNMKKNMERIKGSASWKTDDGTEIKL
jgi:signal transduction histidine kinase